MGLHILYPEKDLLIFPERRVSYAKMAGKSLLLARSLQGSGIQSGDHIGILAPNLIEVIELLFAIALCDVVAVFINARYKTHELSYVIENTDIKLLFSTNRIEDYVDFPELLYESLEGLNRRVDPSLPLQLDAAPKLKKVVLLDEAEKPGLMSFSQFINYANEITEHEAWNRRQQVKLSNPCIYDVHLRNDRTPQRLSPES